MIFVSISFVQWWTMQARMQFTWDENSYSQVRFQRRRIHKGNFSVCRPKVAGEVVPVPNLVRIFLLRQISVHYADFMYFRAFMGSCASMACNVSICEWNWTTGSGKSMSTSIVKCTLALLLQLMPLKAGHWIVSFLCHSTHALPLGQLNVHLQWNWKEEPQPPPNCTRRRWGHG